MADAARPPRAYIEVEVLRAYDKRGRATVRLVATRHRRRRRSIRVPTAMLRRIAIEPLVLIGEP